MHAQIVADALALNAYLARFGRAGRPGVGALRELLRELDPMHLWFLEYLLIFYALALGAMAASAWASCQ